jgi:hypothetical protein
VAGRRLPHGWLTIDGDRRSVLELVDPDAFTVFLLDDRVDAPDPPPGVPVSTVRLRAGDPRVAEWVAAVGLDGRSAVLVRPDGHILGVAADADELAGFAHAIMRHVGTREEAATWT